MRVVVSFLIALCAFVPGVRADWIHPENITPGQAYRDKGAPYPVGWMRVTRSDGTFYRGSFTALDDRRSGLASAHVLAEAAQGSQIQYGFGNYFDDLTAGTYGTGSIFNIHPSYQGLGIGYDHGVFHSDDLFPVLGAQLYDGPLTVGMNLSMIGYGMVGYPGGTLDNLVFDGNKRGIEGRLDRFNLLSSVHVESLFRRPSHSQFNPLGGQLAPIGSGGGVFTEINGQEFLAGANSLYSLELGYFGSSSPTMLDVPQIRSSMYTSAVPEPSSVVLVGFSCMVALFHRRRDKNAAKLA